MKKNAKTLIVVAVCAVLLVGAVVAAAIVVPKVYVPHAKAYAAQFSAARADYDAAAAYLKTLTKKDAASAVTVSIPTVGEENTLYFFRDNGSERVKTVAVEPETMAHLDAVASAFAAAGFELKSMRVAGETVTFTAAGDVYRVRYTAADEKPEAPDGMRVKKLDACWYQIVRVEN